MTKQELTSLYVIHDGITFTPKFEYKTYNSITEEYEGFCMLKKAEEVYQEWLSNKDKEQTKILSVEERLAIAEAQLQASTTNQEFLEGCLMEMAQMVYA